VLTVRCGDISITEGGVRKVVRVVNQQGKGIKNVLVEMGAVSSREKLRFRTDKDGRVLIKTSNGGASLSVDVGPASVHFIGGGGALKFPVAVEFRQYKQEGKKNRQAPPGGERLHPLLTVKCGSIPGTDGKARKVVRVRDRHGKGIQDVLLVVQDESVSILGSRWEVPVEVAAVLGLPFVLTDKDGLAVINKGTGVLVYAGGVHVRLSGGVMKFPVEVVLWKDEKER